MSTRTTFDHSAFTLGKDLWKPRMRNVSAENLSYAGIQWLSREIELSPVLAQFRPLELVSSGGFVSVMYLGNRSATQDFDYFFSRRRFGGYYDRVRAEMHRITRVVAQRLRYDDDWANDEMTAFLNLLNNPERLFDESKQQRVVLHSDANLIIYAVKWEWILARKLKRVQMPTQRPRAEDWSDCASVARLLYLQNGNRKLSPSILERYDETDREAPVLVQTIGQLKTQVWNYFQLDVLPDAVWIYTHDNALRYQWDSGEQIDAFLWPRRTGVVNI